MAIETIRRVSLPRWCSGSDVTKAQSAEEAIEMAGLDWTVELTPALYTQPLTKKVERIPGAYATTRMDNGAALGVVGSFYQVVQNRYVFDFADYLLERDVALYQMAGGSDGGRVLWLLVNILGDLPMPAGEKLVKLMLISSSHDGSASLRASVLPYMQSSMVVMNCALGVKREYKTKHTKNFKAKEQDAAKALKIAEDYFQALSDTAFTLAGEQMDGKRAASFLDALFPDEEGKNNTRKANARADIMGLFKGAGSGMEQDGLRETRWGMLNVVSEWVDHDRTVRRTKGRDEAEARLNSVWFGSAEEKKSKALDLLLHSA